MEEAFFASWALSSLDLVPRSSPRPPRPLPPADGVDGIGGLHRPVFRPPSLLSLVPWPRTPLPFSPRSRLCTRVPPPSALSPAFPARFHSPTRSRFVLGHRPAALPRKTFRGRRSPSCLHFPRLSPRLGHVDTLYRPQQSFSRYHHSSSLLPPFSDVRARLR